MNHRKLIRRYYETRVTSIPEVDPPDNLIRSAAAPAEKRRRFRGEDLLGLLITIGYLSQLLLPTNWFSFNRLLFVFRLGF